MSLPDRDIYAAALILVKRYGDRATIEAGQRARLAISSEAWC